MLKILGHMPVLFRRCICRYGLGKDVLNGGFSIRHLKKHLQRLLEQGCLSEVQFFWDTRGITMESTSSCLVIVAVQNTFHNLMWLLLECTCFYFPLIHISSVFFVHRIFAEGAVIWAGHRKIGLTGRPKVSV